MEETIIDGAAKDQELTPERRELLDSRVAVGGVHVVTHGINAQHRIDTNGKHSSRELPCFFRERRQAGQPHWRLQLCQTRADFMVVERWLIDVDDRQFKCPGAASHLLGKREHLLVAAMHRVERPRKDELPVVCFAYNRG